MNDDALPPITVNQPISDGDSDNQPVQETDNLDKLENNLDEPNMADPLPPAEPTSNMETPAMQAVDNPQNNPPINPNPNPSPNPSNANQTANINLQSAETANNFGQSSNIGRRASLIMGLLITAIAILSGIAISLFYQDKLLKDQSAKLEEIEKTIKKEQNAESIASKTKATPTPEPIEKNTDPTASWQTYSNDVFSVKYPENWRLVENDNWVGFGPEEIKEDSVMNLNYYDKSEKTTKEIKDEIGIQFSDRKQTEKKITINNLEATQITTNTKEIKNWESVEIILETEDMTFVISNGAQTDEGSKVIFENFYNSFKIITKSL